MDLTTLAAAVLVTLGLLATDAVLHSGSVAVEVAAPANIYRDVIDQEGLEAMFTAELDRIAAVVSVVNPTELRAGRDGGIGMTVAEAVNVKSLAFALQRQLGYEPDRLRFGMFLEDGKLRGMVSGHGHVRGNFSREFVPEPGEKLVTFVDRAAVWGAAQVAPYSTALFLLQSHIADGDFREVTAVCERAIAERPPAPVSEARGQFENLLGLVALFQNDPHAARLHFEEAVAVWPDGVVPMLNVAFTEPGHRRHRGGGAAGAQAAGGHAGQPQGGAGHRPHHAGGRAAGGARPRRRRGRAGQRTRHRPRELRRARPVGAGEGVARQPRRGRPAAPAGRGEHHQPRQFRRAGGAVFPALLARQRAGDPQPLRRFRHHPDRLGHSRDEPALLSATAERG